MGFKTKALAGRHLLFVVNTDWFFISHRLPLALAALDASMKVTVCAQDSGHRSELEAKGIRFVDYPLTRSGKRPLQELAGIWALRRLYTTLKPDIVHQVTPKPVIYGTLAARGLPIIPINAISGLGFSFTGDNKYSILRFLVSRLYRLSLSHPKAKTIFQNPDDRKVLCEQGFVQKNASVMIRGAGVDCNVFAPKPEPTGQPVVLFPARLLHHKGIREFVQAAQILLKRGIKAQFVLVGKPDPGNPTSIDNTELDRWVATGDIQWWGHCDDMADVLNQANLVVLPSYREGLPKALLEAAACGRAIVSTDVPGCREICLDGKNGILVEARKAAPLANAIETLLNDPKLRAKMGRVGRQMALDHFSIERVVDATFDLYRQVLGT